MSLCGIGVRTTNVTINQAMLEIIAGATSRLFVYEICVLNSSGVSFTIGLGRPAVKGITPTSPVALLRMDPADGTCDGTTALQWGTPPTFPGFFMRRFTLVPTAGTGVLWTWPKALVISLNNTITIANISGTQASDVNITAEES